MGTEDGTWCLTLRPVRGPYYANVIRSATQGRGSYSMEFHFYRILPNALAEALRAETVEV